MKKKAKTKILYRGYLIELNDYFIPSIKGTKYVIYNSEESSEEYIGMGESIKDCKNQIDGK